jgi:hypothetical protein
VREQQRGSIGRIADTIAGTMKRRQRDREARVLVYDGGGSPRVVPPGSDAHAELVETAERLVALAGGLDAGEPAEGDAPDSGEPPPGEAE